MARTYKSSGKVKTRDVRDSSSILAAIVLITGTGFYHAWGKDIRITIPKHSELTPVQRLNREGVDAVRRHQYEKAEAIFYKAYLYDAADPFTLNNLGYISELQGKLDRAQNSINWRPSKAAPQEST